MFYVYVCRPSGTPNPYSFRKAPKLLVHGLGLSSTHRAHGVHILETLGCLFGFRTTTPTFVSIQDSGLVSRIRESKLSQATRGDWAACHVPVHLRALAIMLAEYLQPPHLLQNHSLCVHVSSLRP